MLTHAAAAHADADAPTHDVYAIRALTLPLPAPLCARIQARLDAQARAKTLGGQQQNACTGRNRAVAAGGAAPSAPSFALRCDWRITVSRSAPSPPLCLSTLTGALHFVLSSYPFAGVPESVEGLARFVALLPSLSATSRGRADPMPAIQDVSVRGQLIRWEAIEGDAGAGATTIWAAQSAPALLESSAQSRAAECAMLGKDTFNPWGDVDILLEQPAPSSHAQSRSHAAAAADASAPSAHHSDAPPSGGLYCLNILPGARIPLHIHLTMSEREFMLSDGGSGVDPATATTGAAAPVSSALLTCQGEPVRLGDTHAWARSQPHWYANVAPVDTGALARVLCVDMPRFAPELEIQVPEREGEKLHRPVTRDRQQLWRTVRATGASFTFPGGLPTQRVTLRTDPATFVQPHAVLVFVFAPASAASSPPSPADPALLFVHHRRRGWELPGGKVDADETAAQAARREVAEEACVQLQQEGAEGETGALTCVAQYEIEEEGAVPHVKSVFVARAAATQGAADATPVPQLETDAARFLQPPPQWTDILPLAAATSAATGADASTSASASVPSRLLFSSILHDNVYPLCLQLALASLSTETHAALHNQR